jgi:hypothetical protein
MTDALMEAVAVGTAAGEGIAIMSVFSVRSAVVAVAAVSAITAGGLAPAAAATRTPGTPAARASTGYSVAGGLVAVAATSTTNAWAVGATSTSRPLIVHWNGHAWRSVATGAPKGSSEMKAVAASSADNAWAIDQVFGSRARSVLLHWNGHTWKQASVRVPAGTTLASVSVTASGNTWAVGYHGNAPYRPLALHWNGRSWKSVSLPRLPLQAHEGAILNSVSATSPTNAWAAGAFNSEFAGPGTGFTLHWNGRSWSRVASAPASHGDPVEVAATAARLAWLIGCPCQGGPAGAVTGFWNGKAWKTVPTPVAKPESAGDGTAVAASGHLAWAAGEYCRKCVSGTPGTLPFILRWTGKGWKLTTVPAKDILVLGLAVTSAKNAWAVGSTSASDKTVILHWNGKAWH